MDVIARFIVKRSKLVLAITALVSLVAFGMLFRMSFNTDVSSFLLEGNETGEVFAALQEKYETTDPINVIATLPDGETFTTSANVALIAQLRDTLSEIDGVESVASVVPELNPLTDQPLTPQAITGTPDEVIAEALNQNRVADLLVSQNGQHTLLIVTPGDDPISTASAVIDVAQDGLELTFSGSPVVWASVLGLLTWFLLILPPLVIALLVIVFFSTIGDLRLSAMAIVPAGLGSLWAFGVIFGAGVSIDLITVIVPIFVIVMGSADGLHFVTHFQEQSVFTDDPIERVRSALSEVGVPMILTTISTAAGFLALMATDVQPIRQLGLFTAIGITFAGIVSFFSLPALMSHLTIKPKHRTAFIGKHVTRALKATVRTRIPAAAITGVIVVFSLWALPQLAVNPDQLFFFKDDDPVRLAFEKTEQLFGGATPLIGEFAFDPQHPEQSVIDAIQATKDLEGLPGVRTVFSVASLAGAMSPEQFGSVVSGDAALPMGKMVSEDGMRFILLPSGFTTEDLKQWTAYTDESDTVTVLTGVPIVWDEIARLVLKAQAVSLGVAYLLVAGMLVVTYRKVRETLVSLVPITLTLATLLSFIAVSGVQLNLLTAVISSIVVGVGIDYAIHYVAAINNARDGTYVYDPGSPATYPMTVGSNDGLVQQLQTVYDERDLAAQAAETTTAKAPDTGSDGEDTVTEPEDTAAESTPISVDDGGTNPILFILAILLLLAAAGFLWWWFFLRPKPDPCHEEWLAWQKAQKDCDDAQKTAKEKRKAADDATKARKKADKDLKDHCKAFPPACGPQSSATDVASGRTVTRDDLHVQKQWAADAWSRYKAGTQSAQETEDQWNTPPPEDFRKKQMEKLEDAKAKTPGLEKAASDAKDAEEAANDAADEAERAAKDACDKAAAAKKAYDDCIGAGAAVAGAEVGEGAGAAGAAVGGIGGAVAGGAAAAGRAAGKSCEKERLAYEAAKKACDEASKAAADADAEARAADKAAEGAEDALDKLCDDFPPVCRDDWIQEAGRPETRITTTDLHVGKAWADKVWQDYKAGTISADEASQRWGQDPPADFRRDELAKIKNAGAKQPGLEKAAKDAKAKADAKRAAADKARTAADDACAKATAARKAWEACQSR